LRSTADRGKTNGTEWRSHTRGVVIMGGGKRSTGTDPTTEAKELDSLGLRCPRQGPERDSASRSNCTATWSADSLKRSSGARKNSARRELAWRGQGGTAAWQGGRFSRRIRSGKWGGEKGPKFTCALLEKQVRGISLTRRMRRALREGKGGTAKKGEREKP